MLGVSEKLENQLKSLYAAMQDGSYAFVDQDLEFMAIVNTAADVWVPFKPLLKLMNDTHRLGLEV